MHIHVHIYRERGCLYIRAGPVYTKYTGPIGSRPEGPMGVTAPTWDTMGNPDPQWEPPLEIPWKPTMGSHAKPPGPPLI